MLSILIGDNKEEWHPPHHPLRPCGVMLWYGMPVLRGLKDDSCFCLVQIDFAAREQREAGGEAGQMHAGTGRRLRQVLQCVERSLLT